MLDSTRSSDYAALEPTSERERGCHEMRTHEANYPRYHRPVSGFHPRRPTLYAGKLRRAVVRWKSLPLWTLVRRLGLTRHTTKQQRAARERAFQKRHIACTGRRRCGGTNRRFGRTRVHQ